jgi:hypothetical protein
MEEKIIRDKLILEEFRQNKNKHLELFRLAYSNVEEILEGVLPGEDKKKIVSLTKKLLNMDKLADEKFKINPKDEVQLKKLKIRELIKSESS